MVAAVVAAATAATVQASLGTGEIAASPPSRRGLRNGHGWQRSQKRGVQTTSSTVYSTSRLVLLNFLNMCLNPCPFPFTTASTASFVVVNDDSYIQRTVFTLQLKKQSQPQTYQMPIPLLALAEAHLTYSRWTSSLPSCLWLQRTLQCQKRDDDHDRDDPTIEGRHFVCRVGPLCWVCTSTQACFWLWTLSYSTVLLSLLLLVTL